MLVHLRSRLGFGIKVPSHLIWSTSILNRDIAFISARFCLTLWYFPKLWGDYSFKHGLLSSDEAVLVLPIFAFEQVKRLSDTEHTGFYDSAFSDQFAFTYQKDRSGQWTFSHSNLFQEEIIWIMKVEGWWNQKPFWVLNLFLLVSVRVSQFPFRNRDEILLYSFSLKLVAYGLDCL